MRTNMYTALNNSTWRLVFGVDYTGGTIMEIWKQPEDRQVKPFIALNGREIRLCHRCCWRACPEDMRQLISKIVASFKTAELAGVSNPNVNPEQVFELAQLLGFVNGKPEEMRSQIREALKQE